MMKLTSIPLAMLFCLFIAFFVVPVSAGLNVTDGLKITSPYGATSPVINVTDSDIPEGGVITIDVLNLYLFVNSGIFSEVNVEISSDSAAATWSGMVSGEGGVDQILTLTSSGGPTGVGENITVTFTGAGGNPWIPGSIDIYGTDLRIPLTVTRTDTYETADIIFMIETPTPPPGGLTITDGEKITTSLGATSPVITIADSDIPDGGTITIDIPDLYLFVNAGLFTNDNVLVSDDATAATWNGAVSGEGGVNQILTLTSSDGPTFIGENITVTFTGAGGNPWLADSFTAFGDVVMPLTITRTDTFQTNITNFMINTTPPLGGLLVTAGAKITSVLGSTSPVITITDAAIAQDGTITIDVSNLNQYVTNGTFIDANVVIKDSAMAANWTGIIAGDPLTLTLISADGATVVGENVTLTFTGAGGNPWINNTYGEQNISLTAVRTGGFGSGTFNFVIETTPPPGFAVVANFTASPSAELAPLTVTFNDTSSGNATSWIWDFGDGSDENATMQNPVHTYTDVGTYTVNLTATNAYGSDIETQWDFIHVLNGGFRQANSTIEGLTIFNCMGPQIMIVDTSILPVALIPNNSVLEIYPPAHRGFKRITIYALDGVGFSKNENLITGNPTSVYLVTEELAPPSGFSSTTGLNASFNISIAHPFYPCNAVLDTKIWEGVIPVVDNNFRKIADGNNASVVGTAYTTTINKTNLPPGSDIIIHMSVDSDWNTYPNLPGGPGMMFIWRISDNETQGQILPTKYLYTDPVDNLNYYEADSPNGLSTFGLSSLTGNNNPFQMITLIVSEIINPQENLPSSETSDTYIPAAVVTQDVTSSTTIIPVPTDIGITAKIYSNEKGVVTQATALQSTDGFATVNINTGIIAKDAHDKPLSSITIKSILAEDLPHESPGDSLSFTGRAYELLPDGATFKPGITINFTDKDVQPGQGLVAKLFNHASGTWEDVPTSTDPQTGITSAHISHFCCFALFAKTNTPEPLSVTPTSPQLTPKAPAPTAMSIFVGMMLWVADIIQKNMLVFVGIVILAVAIFLYGRKRRRDRLTGTG